ncbi:MAG: RNA polymerase sigma factor RpoD/SigA [Gemmatimonadetes bacterium]|nr:RNA polymerase sigma factor RpoD/SigA [Gemmatimonadota bacterium]
MPKSGQSEVNISRVGSRNSGDDRSLDTYLKEIRTIPVLNLQEEMALARDARNGVNGAINKLIQANLRFVVVVARQYQNQGLPLSDLINEGNIGLIKAAQRYDEHKGFKFISYAVWWVRQAIMQALAEQSRIFRLPLNRAEELRRINKVVRGLKQELGREPTTHEIAGKLSLDHRDVVDIMRTFSPHLSLDAPFSPGEEGRLLDVIEDTTIESPETPVMEKSLKEEVVWALNTLTDREAAVIRSYFGINREKPMTLDEIGKQFGLTRERVRQIKERAIRRLRHTSRSVRLHAYMS